MKEKRYYHFENRDKFTKQNICTVTDTAYPLSWYVNLLQPIHHNLHTRKVTAAHNERPHHTEYRNRAMCCLVQSLILYYEGNSDMQIFWQGHTTKILIHTAYLDL
jgi:hypothetical protein